MFKIASLTEIDYLTLLLACSVLGLGLASITGATYTGTGNQWFSQMKWVLLGFPLLVGVLFIDYRQMVRYAPIFYILGIVGLMLCFAPMIGHKSHGASSWLKVGPLSMQPSEVVKLTTLLMLARWLGARKGQWEGLLDVLKPLTIGVLPSLVILAQPDLGTAIVFGPMTLVLMFVAGLPITHLCLVLSPVFCLLGAFHSVEVILLWVAGLTALLLASIWNRVPWTLWLPFLALAGAAYGGVFVYGETIWNKLPSHHQARIENYLNPEANMRDTGYNIMQSKIALGSGGFKGKGMFNSTQAEYEFLPEYEHDFAFSILGEQMGFIGGAVLLGLFLLLITRGVDTAMESRSLEGALIAAGVISIFFAHIFINVGMVTGVLPVTGLPLTFVSYGGTFMLTNMVGVGLLLNIRMQARRVEDPEARFTGRPPMALPTKVDDDQF
ncbi:MAG: FtsW/RodA/SpoVE family cell cycle protein [Candidatus Hinthialibacter antarcticus]|nr:FtsW/RodA/SpoVE family cell cycle protein [Candidatus Hinthialibacter antarcticus]